MRGFTHMKGKMTEHSIRLFEKKGFSKTSVQDIVESVGVTKGTFIITLQARNSF